MLALNFDFLSHPWFIGATLFALVAFPWWSAANRLICRRRLAARDDADIDTEIQAVADYAEMSRDDSRRLWLSLAKNFGVAPEKLRASDRVTVELRGIVSDPDTSLWDDPIFHAHWGTKGDESIETVSVPNVPTLSELLKMVCAYEIKSGRQYAVETSESGSTHRQAD